MKPQKTGRYKSYLRSAEYKPGILLEFQANAYAMEQFPSVRALGERILNMEDERPAMLVQDTLTDSSKTLELDRSARIIRVSHNTHPNRNRMSEDILMTSLRLIDLKETAENILGWRPRRHVWREYIPAGRRRAARAELWRLVQKQLPGIRRWRDYFEARDRESMRLLRSMAGQLRRTHGVRTKVIGPYIRDDSHEAIIRRIASANDPDELADIIVGPQRGLTPNCSCCIPRRQIGKTPQQTNRTDGKSRPSERSTWPT